jgi:hypothetical protein
VGQNFAGQVGGYILLERNVFVVAQLGVGFGSVLELANLGALVAFNERVENGLLQRGGTFRAAYKSLQMASRER